MLTVEEAKQLLFAQVEKSKVVEVDLFEANGFVLAEDVICTMDLPSFDNSSMDGYAVASNNDFNQKQFDVVGEIKAGDAPDIILEPGQSVRIFTGAAIPLSTDSIVLQEKVEARDNKIFLTDTYRKGDFIRRKGSMIKQGELALKKGVVLNPASIGFLTSLGFSKAKVYAKPKVSIIVTGDEIIKPGNELKPGQIYESNSYSLKAALQQMNIETKNILHAADEKEVLRNQLKKCLDDSDIILLTGGISVGKYDLVYDMLKEFNVETIFYKVAQKPGKPFFAGKTKTQLVFALPGNPASVLVCFYEYVYAAIRMISGFEQASLRSTKLKLLKDISNNPDRAQFFRAKIMDDGVMPLDGQDSFMLLSFGLADALIYVQQGKSTVTKNEIVEVHLLPIEN